MLGVGACFNNSADELVAENRRSDVSAVGVRFVQGHHHGPLGVLRDIGAAEAVEGDSNLDVVRADIGHVNMLDSHIARLVQHGGPHFVRHD